MRGVRDPDGDPIKITVQCISQDEPLDAGRDEHREGDDHRRQDGAGIRGKEGESCRNPGGAGCPDEGDGHTEYDAAGIGTDTAQIRAERSGAGDGRVYHLRFTASDPYGGECEGEVLVRVPHDRKSQAIDEGALYPSAPNEAQCGAQPPTGPTVTPPGDRVAEATGPLTPVDIGNAQAIGADGAPLVATVDNPGPYPLGKTTVTWSATDSAGAVISAHQTITVRDTTPPQVAVLGVNPVSIYCESGSFIDSGASATDLVDGDLTARIVAQASGGSFSPPFLVTYSVTDSSGNTATASVRSTPPATAVCLTTRPSSPIRRAARSTPGSWRKLRGN